MRVDGAGRLLVARYQSRYTKSLLGTKKEILVPARDNDRYSVTTTTDSLLEVQAQHEFDFARYKTGQFFE